MAKVAVIGCTHAGVFATTSILQSHPDWEVHVFERNDTVSFLSCGIALWVGEHVSDPDKMFYSSPAALEKAGAHMHMTCDVTSADAKTKHVCWTDLKTNETHELDFDYLVITTGSKPVVPPIPGIEEEHVLLCKNWGHAKKIKEKTKDAKSVIVIGAGYIGAELAEQLSDVHKEVTLIDAFPRVLAKNFDEEVTTQLEEVYKTHGVSLALGQKVTAFEPCEKGIRVITEKGSFEAEYAILGIGFLPRTDLFTGQLDMIKNGAIRVDNYMRTSEPGVFAAGDSATITFNPTGKEDYIPLATNAVRQALVIGANLTKPTVAYAGTQATNAVQLYDYSMSSTGVTMETGAARGMELTSTSVTENYRPEFMLTTAPVTATLVWDPRTREIKGAQFFSTHDDVAQAANVVSVAIANHMTIDQLAQVDLLFQPNFTNPVNYIGSVAMKAAATN